MMQAGDDPNAKRAAANRFQARHALLLDGFCHVVADSTVLVLGAGNGQWCYAYAAAGALNVIGVEADQTLVDGFSDLPDTGLRERIEMRCSDPFAELEREIRCSHQHDIVALLDVLPGQGDLHGVFRQVAALAPPMVIAMIPSPIRTNRFCCCMARPRKIFRHSCPVPALWSRWLVRQILR